jgi:hypothetical protein
VLAFPGIIGTAISVNIFLYCYFHHTLGLHQRQFLRIIEGKATCRLYSKSLNETDDNSCWKEEVTSLYLAIRQTLPEPVFGECHFPVPNVTGLVKGQAG